MLADIDIIMRVFYEKYTYLMTINREIFCENSLFSSLSLLVKSFEEKIQPSRDHVVTTKG